MNKEIMEMYSIDVVYTDVVLYCHFTVHSCLIVPVLILVYT